eukprot:815497_1
MSATVELVDELVCIFESNKQFEYDTVNDAFLPGLESNTNPYSLQALIGWVYNIENNHNIIALDFDNIEKDLGNLKEQYGAKIKGLFYPNWRPYKYTFEYDEYKHKHYDRTIYDTNKQNINNIYKKLFGDTESIIHYILDNKTFLFKLPSPDVDSQQPKLNIIKNMNGDALFKLNMKQSIYILRLLLFKYQIIEPNALFKDNCTIIYDIENKLREMIVTHTFTNDDHEIERLYLDLLCDIYSISENQGQKAMINIFIREEEKRAASWYHANFFDDDTRLEYNHKPTKISFRMMKQLLFRGILPFQITNRKHISDYEVEIYDHLTIHQQSKLFHQCFYRTLDNFPRRCNWIAFKTATMPFIVCDIANAVKIEMQHLLKDIMTKDCIECVLSFVYLDWNELLPHVDDQSLTVKVGKCINYLYEITVEEMEEKERIRRFDEPFLTESMSKHMFHDLLVGYERWMGEEVFVCQGWNGDLYNFGLKAIYEWAKLERLPTQTLRGFVKVALESAGSMDKEARNTFIDIVSIHALDEKRLKMKSFMNWYKERMHLCIVKLCVWSGNIYGDRIRKKFLDGILTDTLPANFEEKLDTKAKAFLAKVEERRIRRERNRSTEVSGVLP